MTTLQASRRFTCRNINEISDLEKLWNKCDILTVPSSTPRRLVPGFACSERAMEAALRLRYQVFNEELGHGSSFDGLDQDEFDRQMTHLLLVETETLRVVGTYRVQTVEQGLLHKGIYSAQEYDMTSFTDFFPYSVECGRACIAPEYRKATSLFILWMGLKAYMNLSAKRWFFGCCSISSHHPADGWLAMKTIRQNGYLHPDLMLPATPGFSCRTPHAEEEAAAGGEALALPKLFSAYMRLGAKVISEPAIDREFGTVDFLILIDGLRVNMANLSLG